MNGDDLEKFFNLIFKLDINIAFGNGYNTIFDRSCKSRDIEFIKECLSYKLIDEFEIYIDDPKIVEELSELLKKHKNVKCDIIGEGFRYTNGEINYDYGNMIAQEIFSKIPCNKRTIRYKDFKEASEYLAHGKKASYDSISLCEQDERVVMTGQQLLKILNEIDEIKKIANEKSENECYIEEVRKTINGYGLTDEGIKN